MDLDKFKKDLDAWLESDHANDVFASYARQLNRQTRREESLYKIYGDNIDPIIKKVIGKYKECSDNSDLYWFLLEYAIIYGREATYDEWGRYNQQAFVTSMHIIGNYVLSRMDGLGSFVLIDHIDSL